MSTVTTPDTSSPTWPWVVVGRWQALGGIGGGEESCAALHRSATAVAVAWTLLSVGVLLCLRRRIFPPTLKYVSTALDIILLTCLALAVAGPTGGTASPPVFIYFLIIVLAALRFNLRLVWMATLGSMAGYMTFVGAADLQASGKWFDEHHAVPVIEQLMMLLALGLTGVVVGQIIRRVRAVPEELNVRLQAVQTNDAAREE